MDADVRDPDGYAPGDIVERLCRTVSNGTYGIDYTVRPGEKEQKLRDDYIVDDKIIADILCSLEVADWMEYQISTERGHEKDVVHFFEKICFLMPRLKEEADKEKVKLYIKITWAKPSSKLFIISFHEYGLF